MNTSIRVRVRLDMDHACYQKNNRNLVVVVGGGMSSLAAQCPVGRH